MTAPDDEFDDFLRRRKPLFTRPGDDDVLEPPAELDRIVLRQARDAIEAPRAQRLYRAPRWSAPLAVAATLALAFTVVLQLMPARKEPRAVADVSLQNAARRIDAPAEAPAAQPAIEAQSALADSSREDGAVIVQLDPSAADPMVARESRARDAAATAPAAPPPPGDLVADAEADRYAEPPTPGIASARRSAAANEMTATATPRAELAKSASAGAGPVPEYRRDEKTWLAEIERLRKSGDVLRAEAELAAYKEQHRAYATGPDR